MEKFILSKEEAKKVKTKLLDPSRTRWVGRIDGLDLFEDEFVSNVNTLGFSCLNPESKVNRDTVSRSQALLNHLSNFAFIVTLVGTRKIFDFTHSVTELLQAKSNDIVVGFDLIASLIDVISNARVNIDFLFGKWNKHALELAQKVSVDETKPRVCSKQTDRENHSADSIADYKISLAIPLIDIVLSELKRRFEGNQTFIFSGFYIIQYIMASSPNWRDHFKDFLKFYKDDFENTSLSTVDGELQLWKQHWINSKAALPDSVSATLKRINFPCFPIIKTALCCILCM